MPKWYIWIPFSCNFHSCQKPTKYSIATAFTQLCSLFQCCSPYCHSVHTMLLNIVSMLVSNVGEWCQYNVPTINVDWTMSYCWSPMLRHHIATTFTLQCLYAEPMLTQCCNLVKFQCWVHILVQCCYHYQQHWGTAILVEMQCWYNIHRTLFGHSYNIAGTLEGIYK